MMTLSTPRSFLLLFLFLTLSTVASAQNTPEAPPRAVNPEKYRWLYEALIPQIDRDTQPEYAFKSFRVHLNDTDEKFPSPEKLGVDHLNLKTSILGKITYIGFIQKRYNYDVVFGPSATDVTVLVKIHFKNPQGEDLDQLKQKLSVAEQIWNLDRVPLDFNYRFQFQIANSLSEAHFSVSLLDSTRGPYDTVWSRGWSATTVAHEIGHMLGLADEYETITSVSNCLPQSLMCESNKAHPMPHHYYFILRRLMN